MSAPWAQAVVPVCLGVLTGLSFDATWAGPTWAQCLGPALAGLLEGLFLAPDRLAMTSARARRSRPLRVHALAAFALTALVLSFLEQRLANVLATFPFAIRAAFVAGFAAGAACMLGHKVFEAAASGSSSAV